MSKEARRFEGRSKPPRQIEVARADKIHPTNKFPISEDAGDLQAEALEKISARATQRKIFRGKRFSKK